MHDLPSLKAALASAPVHTIKGKVTRLVPHLDLSASPDWLFTSGKANRYNPAGLKCIYFGQSMEVAQLEYDEGWKGHPGGNQPVTTFHAEVSLKHTLDLADPVTLNKLKLTDKDLFANWRRAQSPTLTQQLGQAVYETRWFSAIRFPSAAAAKRGKTGTNIVIFPDCLDKKDLVRVHGPNGSTLAQWPL